MHSFYFTAKNGEIVPSNKRELSEYLSKHEGKTFFAQVKREKGIRTAKQNNALHLGCSHIAKTLNESGLDMKKVLKQEVDIPWSTDTVKEYLVKPIVKAMFGKSSTTELNNVSDINEMWDVLMKMLGEKFHVEYVPFPSEENKDEAPIN